ncbi:hypothetical protein I4U23_022390 [Adineta vaga]|nr:hypothetical protein I4U23_022390 [Adineta vaga]
MIEANPSKVMSKSSVDKRLYQYLIKVNLYQYKENLIHVDQLIATCVYIGLLITFLCALVLYIGLTVETHTVTVDFPSVAQFEILSNQYPSTLSCLCSRMAIPYNKFLSFNPEYHQVCSSDFVSQSWISSLFSNNPSNYYPLDFHTSASSQFEVLALLCQTIAESVSEALQQSGMKELITIRALSKRTFTVQSVALLQQIQMTTIANIKRVDKFVSLSISQNYLMTALKTDAYIVAEVGGTTASIYRRKYSLNKTQNGAITLTAEPICSCEFTSRCTSQSSFFNYTILNPYPTSFHADPPLLFSVPGMLAGCIPRYSMLQSTLECFYSSTCLYMVMKFTGITSYYRSLNTTIHSRFKQNTTIESMFDDLLIEQWHNASDFNTYYNECAPATCSYIYTERLNIVHMLITILGLVGGLTTTLHLFSPFFVKHIFRRMQKICCCRTRNKSQMSSANNQALTKSKHEKILAFAISQQTGAS